MGSPTALALGGIRDCGMGNGDCVVANVEVAGGDGVAEAFGLDIPSLARASAVPSGPFAMLSTGP